MANAANKQDNADIEQIKIAAGDVIIVKTLTAIDSEKLRASISDAGIKNSVLVLPAGASIEILSKK